MSKPLSESGRIQHKKKLIGKILEGINRKKHLHRQRAMKYKNLDHIFEGILVAFSTVTLSSIVLQYMDASPYIMLVSAIFSSLNMVGSTVKKTIGLSNRWAESKGIHTALNDLSREVTIMLAKNHLSSEDLDNMLNDVHHRLSLIEDRSPLIGDAHTESQINMTLTPESTLRALKIDRPSM